MITALSFGVAGCAAERAMPDPIGERCDASSDCMGGSTDGCDYVRLCVAGRCEAIGDAGVPESRIVRCEEPAPR